MSNHTHKPFTSILDYCPDEKQIAIENKINSIPMLGKFRNNENISGLPCRIFDNATVIILEDWLYKKWRKFGWKEKIPAVGLNRSVLRLTSHWNKLIVLLDKNDLQVYVAKPDTLLLQCNDFIETYKDGLRLFTCPKNLFYRYKNETIDEVRQMCP